MNEGRTVVRAPLILSSTPRTIGPRDKADGDGVVDQYRARNVTPTVRGSPGLPMTRPELPDWTLTNCR